MIVIGKDTMEDIYKYSENYVPEDEKYTKDEIIEDQKLHASRMKEHLEEYNQDPEAYIEKMGGHKDTPHIKFLKSGEAEAFANMSDEELYRKYLDDYPHITPNEDGSMPVEWNSNGQYDWYTLGGRWQGMLKLKNDRKEEGIVGGLSTFGGEYKNDRYDGAPFGAIDWESEAMKDFSLFGWVDSDGWFDRYSTGMDGDDNLEKWRQEFKDRLLNINDDEMVYVVDFHV